MSNIEMFQLDDQTAKSIPSAVLITEGNSINCINGKTIIGEVYMSDLIENTGDSPSNTNLRWRLTVL